MHIKSKLYPELPRFLTIDEYAALTKTTKQTIHNRIWKGNQLGVIRDSGQKNLIDIDLALQPKGGD